MVTDAIRKLRPQRPMLTKKELFDLWKAAIKDDDRTANDLIQMVYDQAMGFDAERTAQVMELMVRRDQAARGLFQDLLKDLQVWHAWTHASQRIQPVVAAS